MTTANDYTTQAKTLLNQAQMHLDIIRITQVPFNEQRGRILFSLALSINAIAKLELERLKKETTDNDN